MWLAQVHHQLKPRREFRAIDDGPATWILLRDHMKEVKGLLKAVCILCIYMDVSKVAI